MSEAGAGLFYPDSDDEDEFAQSATACCPRQTIPDSCSCLEGCGCLCADCECSWCDDDEEWA